MRKLKLRDSVEFKVLSGNFRQATKVGIKNGYFPTRDRDSRFVGLAARRGFGFLLREPGFEFRIQRSKYMNRLLNISNERISPAGGINQCSNVVKWTV